AFRLPLPRERADGTGVELGTSRDAVLGVRPEDLYLASNRPDLGETEFTARVDVTEPLGDNLLVHCSVGDELIKMQAAPRSSLEPGGTVTVTYDPARLHLFDPETGDAFYHSTEAVPSDQSVEQTAGD
ncbi:MAG: TOBE domain-containing protein, partial [Halolamina sp.]